MVIRGATSGRVVTFVGVVKIGRVNRVARKGVSNRGKYVEGRVLEEGFL